MPKHSKNFKTEGDKTQEELEFTNLEELVREGARRILTKALENEMEYFLQDLKHLRTDEGLPAVVRNGYHKSRHILMGGGIIEAVVPRTRNRLGGENFTSALVPPYMRKSTQIEEGIPLLYLYGVSEKDMENAVRGLFGDAAKGISASSVSRMKKAWTTAYQEWHKRRFDGKKYCYVWVDGIYFNVQGSEDRLCSLVMIGVNENGEKELIMVEEGYRESSEIWALLLRQMKENGLKSPKLFIGDGSLGFWKAVKEVYPEAKTQRCWVHKMRNILDKLPKTLHGKAKSMLKEIYSAPDETSARKAAEVFNKTFETKYYQATECLIKDLDVLLTFYQFPAEHWVHIRSTNAIESTFSTVRLRTNKMRGCGNRETILVMVYKLVEKASKRWRKLRGHEKIKMILEGVSFLNGLMVDQAA
jgi:transposase-like protein